MTTSETAIPVEPARVTSVNPAAVPWLQLHYHLLGQGSFLGRDWGDDRFVHGFIERFLLPYVTPDCVALEIGPGGGRYAEQLLPRVRRLTVVDLAPEILQALAQRVGAPAHLELCLGDGRGLAGLPSQSFDLIYAVNLFQFLSLENAYSYLRDIAGLLTEQGVAVIQYADFSNPDGRRYFLTRFPDWNRHGGVPLQFHYLSRSFVTELLDSLDLVAVNNVQHHRDSVVVFRRQTSGRPRHRAAPVALDRSPRWHAMSPELDLQEQLWWRRTGELAQQAGSWVTDVGYLRRITANLPNNATIVEFGCGSGWLCQHLARAGAHRVIGIDFTQSQIDQARAVLPSELKDRVEFIVTKDIPNGLQADVVVCHAVLHHLTWSELDRVRQQVEAILPVGGSLWLLEPVLGTGEHARWRCLPRLIQALFSPWRGLRPMSRAERALRNACTEHNYGKRMPGHGPSPKELPFRIGELEAWLGAGWQRQCAEPVFLDAHLVAEELQRFGITFRRLASCLRRPVLWLVGLWERMALRRFGYALGTGWVFTMFQFRRN